MHQVHLYPAKTNTFLVILFLTMLLVFSGRLPLLTSVRLLALITFSVLTVSMQLPRLL